MSRLIMIVLIGLLAASSLAGQEVRVRHETAIRSGPSQDSYTDGRLNAGETVHVIEWSASGTPYASISAPAKCVTLLPAAAVDTLMSKPRQFPKIYHTRKAADTLIDGNPGPLGYQTTRYPVPPGAAVTLLNVKNIYVLGKEQKYYQMKALEAEFRYVLAADLEQATTPAFKMPSMPVPQKPAPSSSSDLFPHPQTSSAPTASLGEVEQLPEPVVMELQAADRAYRQGITTRAWEDARHRYNALTQSPYTSVRIIAINRLDFIRQWQLNPPSATPPRQIAEGVTVNLPQYQPEAGLWSTPGTIPRTAVAPTNPVNPPKQVTIRPDQPPAVASRPVNPAASPLSVPTYQGQPTANQPQPSGTPTNTQPRNAVPTNVQPQTVTQRGKLHRAVQHDGFDWLYYLENSQGSSVYFVKAMTTSRINLSQYVGRYVEVVGTVVDRRADLGKYQINATSIKELR